MRNQLTLERTKKLLQKTEMILSMLRDILQEALFLSEKQIHEIINLFFERLTEHFKLKKHLCAC